VWNRLTIFKKGLVLISVPLLFQLAFFGLLADMQHSNARVVGWTIHSKEVLRHTQVVLRNLLEMGTGMRGYILAADADLGAAYERAAQQLPGDVRALQASVKEDPVQSAQVQAIAKAIDEFTAWHAETMVLSGAGKREQAIERAKSLHSNQLYNAIVQTMSTFVKTEDALDRERTQALEQSMTRQQWLLWLGAGTTFLITLALAFVFSRSIGGRLATLAENAQRLVHGKELAPPVRGTDEVAQLDQAFRRMAREIAQSAETLRQSADEIRGLFEQTKKSEEEIRRLNEGLERRIAERTAELARANDALREGDRRKDEFLAMLAHELRNPLAPLRNALQIVKMPGLSEDGARQAQDMMERQVAHMVRLVDDLLDVSRIMRGKIELRKERVDLATVFARAVETIQPTLDARGQELIVSLPAQPMQLEGDLIRLAQVIGNLLMNAAKYSDTAGRIHLIGERDGSQVVVQVRDSGIGIAPEILPHIFDLFAQADRSLARSRGGLGIGLTLVRQLVDMHEGSVVATSGGSGKGSEFTVRLPALPDTLAEKGGSMQESSAVAGPCRRVLVVDDNVDAADSAALLLRLWGHEVAVVYNGPAALETARHFRPEIALLDIGLPGISGYEVARSLRALPELRDLVLAAVTGYGQEEDRRRSREAGFNFHLTKPLAPEALTSVVTLPRASTGSFVIPHGDGRA
jgi:signal transduction histidine kinase